MSLEGEAMPIVITETFGDITCTFTFASLVITFQSGGAFSATESGSDVCTGEEPDVWEDTFTGTWTATSTTVTLVQGGTSSTLPYSISGNTLTVVEGTGTNATTSVFTRVN